MRTLTLLLLLASGVPVLAQGPAPEAPPRSLQAGMADLRLATAVRLALVDDPRTRVFNVQVVARDGTVAVAGIEDAAYQAVAARIASGVPRVRALQGLGAAGLNATAASGGIPGETEAGDAPEAAPVLIPEPEFHRVRRGDTLYGIARRYNTTLQDLVRINSLRSTNIRIGQRLRVR